MLGLPKSTELSKQLPKKAIYAKFNMSVAEKERFDANISRINIVNEISAVTTAIAESEKVKSIYVLQIVLKKREYDEKSVIMLTKLIPQNMVLVLEHEDECCLAVYCGKLIHTGWQKVTDAILNLKGLDFDEVWENIIIQIGGINVEDGKTLDEQIAENERKEKLKKEIARLEKQARTEKQPKKKFELVQIINELKGKLK